MSELKRHMGLFGTTMYGIGLILGAGIYVLIGQAAGIAGNVVWVSFVFGAVAAVFSGLSYAELSSMFPKSAAEFLFVKNSFKNNFLAFLIGWMTLFTSVISASTVALGFGGYLTGFFGAPIVVPAVSLIALLSLINFIGIRESSLINIVFILIIYLDFTKSFKEPVDDFKKKTIFIQDYSLMPMKLIKDSRAINDTAGTTIGAPKNPVRYPPKPNATVDAEITDVKSVIHPIRKARKLFLNAFLTNKNSAADFGNIEDNSA